MSRPRKTDEICRFVPVRRTELPFRSFEHVWCSFRGMSLVCVGCKHVLDAGAFIKQLMAVSDETLLHATRNYCDEPNQGLRAPVPPRPCTSLERLKMKLSFVRAALPTLSCTSGGLARRQRLEGRMRGADRRGPMNRPRHSTHDSRAPPSCPCQLPPLGDQIVNSK